MKLLHSCVHFERAPNRCFMPSSSPSRPNSTNRTARHTPDFSPILSRSLTTSSVTAIHCFQPKAAPKRKRRRLCPGIWTEVNENRSIPAGRTRATHEPEDGGGKKESRPANEPMMVWEKKKTALILAFSPRSCFSPHAPHPAFGHLLPDSFGGEGQRRRNRCSRVWSI